MNRNDWNGWKETLSAQMRQVDFQHMSPAEQHCFVADAVMRLCRTERRNAQGKQAFYLSAEYLLGRLIENNLLNLSLYEDVRWAMEENGVDISVFSAIPDDALGNGGLGRLAACYLDAAATHRFPLSGYGIRYRYGLFRQDLSAGRQREYPDDWMRGGDPWSVRRDGEAVTVTFADSRIRAVPYDMPIFGWKTGDEIPVTNLRLWQAEPMEPLDFQAFNDGDYVRAAAQANAAERICALLYPNDATEAGRELRLRQQYFLSEASVLDILRRFTNAGYTDYRTLPDFAAVQLNDTHPVLAIPTMILHLTRRGLPFSDALTVTRKLFAYTNHTVMREALEVWHAALWKRCIPDALQITEQIQNALEKEISAARPDMNILDGQWIHMARLACYVCHSVNGVAPLHTEILQKNVLQNWYATYPEKFSCVTNGISQRRWLALANPHLAAFVTGRVGDGWLTDASVLSGMKPYAEEASAREEFLSIRRENKRRLAAAVRDWCGIDLSPDFVFDIQIKRLHEYKRQLMNAFSIVRRYLDLRAGKPDALPPTAYFFGAKSAPGYLRARGIIAYILAVAEVVNHDPTTQERMQVIFVPDYNVSAAEKMVAAGDLSEQISAAGTEASGTGNMKFMMNGVPTVGTYDGANLEILSAAGEENNFFFGPTAQEMRRRMEHYDPHALYLSDARLAQVADTLIDGTFPLAESAAVEADALRELHSALLREDAYCLFGDFAAYETARTRALQSCTDPDGSARRGILNLSSSGGFSADRSVKEYAKTIWHIQPYQ